ncbi:MAG TPA: methylated-DNA--[protein]-cysteine S-methyltransferase [Solirubrobacterales bacterium]|nr:methylated-DNA--[protein]-cysteine S-methyltransferase [Solirubrobacterales bacterium]
MNPITEKQLERMLRSAPSGADLDRAVEGVLLRAERDGLIDVAYAGVDSPFGTLLLARTSRGVVKLALPSHRGTAIDEDEVLEELARRVSPRLLEAPARLDEERRQLEDYFERRRERFQVPVDWRLTDPGFRARALHAVARIPYGRTRTYAEIARAAGNERAFRAAGTACGTNPVPLFVPCHRVVQSGGGIGNYGGGPEMKRALLALEGALRTDSD